MKIIDYTIDAVMGRMTRLVNRYNKYSLGKKMREKITKNLNELETRRYLTKEQKEEVDNFYISMIGKPVPLYCHEYFYSRTNFFSKDYVPKDFYTVELLPRANFYRFTPAYDDKNIYDILFAGENVAHPILKNMNGYYYFEGRAVSEEEALDLCKNLEKVIIKPALEKSGSGVRLLTVKDGVTNVDGRTLKNLFDEYKRNFLIQKCVKQHKDLAALNPTSVNTLRILSYRSGMEVLILYSVIRIGRSGQVIDNQCAGGISTIITKDGKLGKTAFGGYSEDNVLVTDTGITLDGYQLPSYDKTIDFVKRLHLKLPYLNIVGWDISIEENGEPILIEFNTHPGLSQSAFCSGMGENTERIIRELWHRPNTRF